MENIYSVNKEPPKKAIKYTISPAIEGFVLGLFALCLTFITAYFIYSNSMEVIEQEIKDGLLRTVSGMAALIDGEKIASFKEAKDAEREDYQEIIKMLQKARLGTKHCAYIYINTVVDNKIYFLVDPISVDEDGKPIYSDAASLEPSIPMTPYEDACEDLIKAAYYDREPTITDKIYTDRWGTFHSAYAPIFNKKKQVVGTLGADLRMDEFKNRCKPMEDATKRAFIVSVSLALLLGTFVWFSRRFTFLLNESRQNIYQNFLVAKRFADQSSSSIGNQYQRTSDILRYEANKLDSIKKSEDKDSLLKNLELEQKKLEKMADKLLTLGELKYSTHRKDLDNFSLLETNKNIIDNIKKELHIEDSDRVTYDIDPTIPEIVYGPVISYEELVGHLYDLFINQFNNPVYSKTTLIDERNKDVVLQQTFSISTKDLDEKHISIAELIAKNIASENWEQQMEISDLINIPIIHELLFVLGSSIKSEIKNDHFIINFEFVLLKSQEEDN